ncbi:ABC transporter ATP-binding protein [Natronococcus sp. A-GB1]|uniref:dipeptide ABC transporter ATP-binding protein n=1 Tax=Natronococcus sp. A-GB1 TaxID=3037648 RepID=UPI00241FDA63|nr:ABC transporter ATP-binding protein [Natronococcus sp. A-GB1]MDG5761793.1 ABC transporter ATP-binding protein [Natronococcus sp. A-GB1]
MSDPLLSVENLHTQFRTPEGPVNAVNGATFTVEAGEIVGLVGESGSGKSVTARSIMGLESPGEIVEGDIVFDSVDLTEAPEATRRRARGTSMSMVFQDPNTSLNPVFDVGEQIAESLKIHESPDSQSLLDYLHVPLVSDRREWQEHRKRAIELMEQVGIADADDRVGHYPHEFSGGMRQRAMLAIALAAQPELLIADEPTTALDTTTQARILDRIRDLRDAFDTAVLLITHDLGVVAETCDRVVVLYGGEVMESGPVERVLSDPQHPYTQGLLDCLPRRSDRGSPLPAIEGSVLDSGNSTPGCPFASRCEYATEACRVSDPPTIRPERSRRVVCGELDTVRQDAESERNAAQPRVDGGDRSIERASQERHEADVQTSGTIGKDGTGRASGWENPESRSDDTTVESETPLLEIDGVSKTFDVTGSRLERVFGQRQLLGAVDEISFRIDAGETVGLVGESGSGKSTLASVIAGLESPTEGEVRFDGATVGTVEERTPEQLSEFGFVFQNPTESLNPRMTVRETLAEPLRERNWETEQQDRRIAELLELVGLSSKHAARRPHELSGGQLQRVAIARAIALEPSVVILDEPVSALDVSIQAKILNLLLELQERLGLTYLVISHDLEVVHHIADRVLVMYLGKVMERGPANALFESPAHPYTEALFEAIPTLEDDGTAQPLSGAIPSPVDPPDGCVFHTRCPMAEEQCRREEPSFETIAGSHSRCHFAEDVTEEPAEPTIEPDNP